MDTKIQPISYSRAGSNINPSINAVNMLPSPWVSSSTAVVLSAQMMPPEWFLPCQTQTEMTISMPHLLMYVSPTGKADTCNETNASTSMYCTILLLKHAGLQEGQLLHCCSR